MQSDQTALFYNFTRGMIGLPVNHLWMGHGSALFLELGDLTPTMRRDGSDGNPNGEMSVMIEWSWRIEGRRSIICGSWSDEDEWPRGFSVLRNQIVMEVSSFGRLPEIDLKFSNDAHCLSFMTAKGGPVWAIFDRRKGEERMLHSRNGRIEIAV